MDEAASEGSDVALEVRQRDDDRRLVGELDAAGVEMDARPEAARAGEALPATLAARRRTVGDADVDRVQLWHVGRPRAEEEARRIGDDGDLATGVGARGSP